MLMKAIDPRNVIALLEYLDQQPHREVRRFIDMLSNLPDIAPPKALPKNGDKDEKSDGQTDKV